MLGSELNQLAPAGWPAELNLGFERIASRTVLTRRSHSGPVRVQRPFYPEGGDVCHVYLLHPPGGLVGGDSVDVRVAVGPRARALLTTPAATKFYRTNGRLARQSVSLELGPGSFCEWFPQETIVFGGALSRSETRVELCEGALFTGWEIVCLGRPAAGDHYTSGAYRSSFELWRGGKPLWIDRCVFEADTGLMHANWGMRGFRVFATLVLSTSDARLVNAIRENVIFDEKTEHFTVSALRDVTLCRYLGGAARRALGCFTQVWRHARPLWWGRPASAPRIWLT